MSDPSSRHVFISYARDDADFVARLRQRLKASHLVTWIDSEDLRAGAEWRPAIDDAIRTSAAVIVVLSPSSALAPYVTYEWAYALGLGIPVIPALHKKTELHLRMEAIQYVDLTRSMERWVRLLRALGAAGIGAPGASAMAIRAEFEMREGRPRKARSEYVVLLRIENAPADAQRAKYRVHHESFKKPVWHEKNPEKDFESWLSSYGDVLISVAVDGGSRTIRAETTLYEALERTHGQSQDPAIREALEAIASN